MGSSISGFVSTLASVGMACGPPLIYADQAYSIVKKRDSTGFSHDVCGVILVANIVRLYFWIGHHFEFTLLMQSILLIISQLALLTLCLHYRPHLPLTPTLPSTSPRGAGFIGAKRPFNFWAWAELGTYFEFLAGLIGVLGVMQLVLGRWSWYVEALGYIALSIESTLPIPQFISNYRRKSTYGFRDSTLAGWFGGDLFKTIYFFAKHQPKQFQVTACMTLAWDTAVLVQRMRYGDKPPAEHGAEDAMQYGDESVEHEGSEVGEGDQVRLVSGGRRVDSPGV